ncbi:MAG: ATP synthase F1 subunit gamma [Lachnospiraceae bacterium]|nr:ATP synthase F1 subunit gamma [Lachnospiraceae bacterium]
MAGAIEIKNRIKSIQDTMKITRAMYMISSNKLQKAKTSLQATEPFFYGIQMQIARLLRHIPEFEHLYFDNRPKDLQETEKRQGFLVVTADKGLAGAYNHNVLKAAEEMFRKSSNPTMYVIGQLGYHYFDAHNIPIEEEFHYTAQNPTMHRARTIADRLVDAYHNEQLDEIYMIYTRMVNGMAEEVVIEKLLPLERKDFTTDIPKEMLAGMPQEQFNYYPSPEKLLDRMVPNYITGFVYGALIESYSCEQNARMSAMKAATDNATDMLSQLSVEYNRVRQASITQEITEVVGGAKALRRKKND